MGDFRYNAKRKEIVGYKSDGDNFISCKKVLALPQHFTKGQWVEIADGILRAGKILVECEGYVLNQNEDIVVPVNKLTEYSGYVIKQPLEFHDIGMKAVNELRAEIRYENRVGTIRIRRACFVTNDDMETMMKMFAEFVPLRFEYDFMEQTMIYSGYSKQFDIVPEGVVYPEYAADFKRDIDDEITFIGFHKLK